MSIISDMNKILLLLSVAACTLLACKQSRDKEKVPAAEAAFDNKDYHTQSNADTVKGTHLFLDIEVSFDQKTITGSALWDIDNPYKKDRIVFDTKDLVIDSVFLDGITRAEYTLAKADTVLGAALNITIKPENKSVKIYYHTTNKATALQWLAPEQTFGKQHPFLYTQSESIHARTWIPVQDGPGVRYTYDAKVTVPKGLMALMSATNPQQKSADGVYTFHMDKPIPAYLMALAVGDIGFRSIDDRTGVYAEPAILGKAYNEFTDVGRMVHTAEELYGPYRWGRYDILVLPSGFPIGGMENPKLTFCTPTILAGDKSLVNLIAHELAHNWSGNLVTNHTWNDFWLNEGFTMYFERRITEAMQGKSYTDMQWELGYQDLIATMEDLKGKPEDTHLRLNLKGRNPDDGLTDIAYEKGAHLLKLIELTVGRAKMDTFLTQYFNDNAFKTMNTKDFIEYLNKHLLDQDPEWKMKININEWVYNAGIPKSCPRADMERFVKVDSVARNFLNGTKAAALPAAQWSTYEWMHFLRQMVAANVSLDQMKDLDNVYHLTQTQNSEKADLWYLLSVKTKYTPAYPAMRSFLYVTGREKFLQPLYKEMMKTPEGKQMALDIYSHARPNYHPLTQKVVDEIVK